MYQWKERSRGPGAMEVIQVSTYPILSDVLLERKFTQHAF